MAEKTLINLDELVSEGQDVLLGGKTYTLRDASVVELLTFMQKQETVTDIEKLSLVIELLYKLCPAGKEDGAFDKMNMEQVMQVFNMLVMGSVNSPVAEAAQTQTESTEPKKK